MRPYTIFWHDDEHTILVAHIHDRWTWGDGYALLADLNAQCDTVQHGVYTVFMFEPHSRLVPRGRSAPLLNLRRLLESQHPNDELILFAGTGAALRNLMNIAKRVYLLDAYFETFAFPRDFDEALAIIKEHRRSRAPQG